MKPLILLGFMVLSTFSAVNAQQKALPKKVASPITRLLYSISLPYRIINDSVAVVPFTGTAIQNYEVVIQRVSDLCIVYTNLSDIYPLTKDSVLMRYLLQSANHFDLIKIGINSQNDVYIRTDAFIDILNGRYLERLIQQVANVTNIMAGNLAEMNTNPLK
jgi:hypothetical protein